MSNLQQKITDLVATAAKESILSPEAMIEITNIVTDHDDALATNKKLAKSLVDLEAKLKEANGKVSLITLQESNVAIREGEVKTREENMLKLELTAEYQEKRVEDHIKMVDLIFRNSILRRTMFGNMPGQINDSGMMPGNVSVNDTVTTKEE